MIRLCALNDCAIEAEGRKIMPDADIVFGMLLFLAAHAGKGVSRAVFTQMFWPRSSDAAASGSLRQAIYRLKVYAPDIETTRTSIVLPEGSVEFDFARLVSETPTPADFLAYRDLRILPDYSPDFSKVFADWVESYRDELTSRLRRGAMRALLVARMKGQFEELEGLAHVCLALDPLNEEATLVLAEATALTGNKARALKILDEYVSELGAHESTLRLPADVLRKRISERIPLMRYASPDDLPLVGRDDVIELLSRRLREAKKGAAQLAFVWGEPGIGKTRATARVLEIAALEGARTAIIRCQPSDEERPLSGIVELIQALIRLPGALGCAPDALAHLQRVTSPGSHSLRSDVSSPDASEVFAGVRLAFLDLMESVLGECFLVIHVDDAQWMNSTSWQLLRDVFERSAASRLGVICTMRNAPASTSPSALRSLWELGVTHELRALGRESAEQLLDAIEAKCAAAMPIAAKRKCLQIAGGNPFFLYELAHHYIAEGRSETLPHSLRSVLEKRLTSLSERSSKLVLAVAFLGSFASVSRLARVISLPMTELLAELGLLEALAMLSMDGASIVCRHGLLAEESVARASALEAALLHQRIAEVLQSELETETSPVSLWACFRHFEAAGDSTNAVAVSVRFAQQLVVAGLADDAIAILERAEEMSTSGKQRIQVLEKLWRANRASGRWEKLSESLSRLGRARADVEGINCLSAEEHFEKGVAQIKLPKSLLDQKAALKLELKKPRLESTQVYQLAVTGLVFADNLYDNEFAEDLVAIADQHYARISAEEILPDVARLVYDTSFGDLERAANLGRRIAGEITQQREKGYRACRLLRWCARPIAFVGDTDGAMSILTHAYKIAVDLRIETEAATVAAVAAEHAIQFCEFELARRWAAEGRGWLRKSADALVHLQIETVAFQLAICAGDGEEARDLFNKMGAERWKTTTPRNEQTYGSMQLAVRLALKLPPELDEVRRQKRSLEGSLSRSCQEYLFEMVLRSLFELGEEDEAGQLAAAYLPVRRESYPLPPVVRQLLASNAVRRSA